MKKPKINLYKPVTISDAINCLETFFEVDMYSKFRPEIKMKGKKWYRQDWFRNENEFIDYLRAHFRILEKEIKTLLRKKKGF